MTLKTGQESIPRLPHPLRRLIKQHDATGLLAPFLNLIPGMSFGMLDQDGRIYTGSGVDEAMLSAAWDQVCRGKLVRDGQLILRPLIIHNYLAGALWVWARGKSQDMDDSLPLIEAVGNGFVRLLEQAVEKRDLGRELLERYREINLLYRAAETIGSSLDPISIPRLVLDQIQPVVPYDMALVLLPSEKFDEALLAAGEDLFESAWRGPAGSAGLLRQAAKGVIPEVIESNEAIIFTPMKSDSSEQVLQGSPGVVMCVPLSVNSTLLGVLLLGRKPGKTEFSAGDEKLVAALGGQAAIALETARLHQEEVKLQRLEEELSIGRQIQLSFLPISLPEIPGWDIAALYRSARQVGGDLYDLIVSPKNPKRMDLVIADATGKGVAAALFMAFTRTVLRLNAIEGGSPRQVLRSANEYILQEQRNMIFMSAFMASINLESGRLVYSNAGHDWPLLREHASGRIRPLEATGHLLGAFEEIGLDEFETSVAPGDMLVFYTDGVTEAYDSQHELYGVHRLEALIARQEWESPQQLLDGILLDVEDFTEDEQQADDLTLLIIQRKLVDRHD